MSNNTKEVLCALIVAVQAIVVAVINSSTSQQNNQ